MAHRVKAPDGHLRLYGCRVGHWTSQVPCHVCEAVSGRVRPMKPRPPAHIPNPRSDFWINLLTGIPPVPAPVHNTPHTEETKARMREIQKEVGQRPAVREARVRGAKKVWKKYGKKVMSQKIRDGWAKRKPEIMAERRAKNSVAKMSKAEKNAAAVAAHMARMAA